MDKAEKKFKVGDVVYLKSDLKKNTAMTVECYRVHYITHEILVVASWLNSRKSVEARKFPEDTLTL
jgi:uncharacterized protein YodC (DUF2158 family)